MARLIQHIISRLSPYPVRILYPLPALLASLLLQVPFTAFADILTDGSLGIRQSLTGNTPIIPETLGSRIGSNLFHSFSEFNLSAQQTATFTGAADILHVIARVTGDTASVINGQLRSTLPNADLYLLNPNGIQFGEQAQLDVQGAFYASTASHLSLADGGQVALITPEDSLLTAAAPVAFGFLSNPAGIEIYNSTLQVPTGELLHLSGGAIRLQMSTLQANTGQLVIAAEQMLLDDSTLAASTVTLTGNTIMIQNGSIINSDAGEGRIALQAEQEINVQGINAESGVGSTVLSSGGAELQIDTPLLTVQEGGAIQTATFGNRGDAGDMFITTQRLQISQLSSISALTLGTGQGGTIHISSDDVVLQENAALNARSVGLGNAGQIRLQADRLLLQDTSLISTTATQAIGGDIDLQIAERLTITDQSGITATAAGGGRGGNIQITTPQLDIARSSSITAASTATGNAGQIEIMAEQLTLTEQSSIDSQALQAAGGNIDLQVTQRLWIRDSQVTARAQGQQRGDDGGNLSIFAGEFVILEDALVLASAVFGDGGTIQLNTGSLIATPSSVIDASSAFGLAGEVFISAPDVDLEEQLLPLSSYYWDASQFIRQRCAERLGHNLSNLFVTHYEILPLAPEWLETYWLEE